MKLALLIPAYIPSAVSLGYFKETLQALAKQSCHPDKIVICMCGEMSSNVVVPPEIQAITTILKPTEKQSQFEQLLAAFNHFRRDDWWYSFLDADDLPSPHLILARRVLINTCPEQTDVCVETSRVNLPASATSFYDRNGRSLGSSDRPFEYFQYTIRGDRLGHFFSETTANQRASRFCDFIMVRYLFSNPDTRSFGSHNLLPQYGHRFHLHGVCGQQKTILDVVEATVCIGDTTMLKASAEMDIDATVAALKTLKPILSGPLIPSFMFDIDVYRLE